MKKMLQKNLLSIIGGILFSLSPLTLLASSSDTGESVSQLQAPKNKKLLALVEPSLTNLVAQGLTEDFYNKLKYTLRDKSSFSKELFELVKLLREQDRRDLHAHKKQEAKDWESLESIFDAPDPDEEELAAYDPKASPPVDYENLLSVSCLSEAFNFKRPSILSEATAEILRHQQRTPSPHMRKTPDAFTRELGTPKTLVDFAFKTLVENAIYFHEIQGCQALHGKALGGGGSGFGSSFGSGFGSGIGSGDAVAPSISHFQSVTTGSSPRLGVMGHPSRSAFTRRQPTPKPIDIVKPAGHSYDEDSEEDDGHEPDGESEADTQEFTAAVEGEGEGDSEPDEGIFSLDDLS